MDSACCASRPGTDLQAASRFPVALRLEEEGSPFQAARSRNHTGRNVAAVAVHSRSCIDDEDVVAADGAADGDSIALADTYAAAVDDGVAVVAPSYAAVVDSCTVVVAVAAHQEPTEEY